MDYNAIRFPHLGILFQHLGNGFSIGGFEIRYYGIIIAAGFLLALYIAMDGAKKTAQNPDNYVDFLLAVMIPAILGARIYYVIFSWDYYKQDIKRIFMIREGGLAIFGGVIAGIIVLYIVSKKKKESFFLMADTIVPGLLIGQILGRWGNFFNREAFGGATDGLFAMQIPVSYFEQCNRLGEIKNTGLLDHTVSVELAGKVTQCIQVHPTFLYESLWNAGIFLLIILYRKHKKYDGQLLLMYLAGYGLGRAMIEGLRVDQLLIGNTTIAVSQLLAATVSVVSFVLLFVLRNRRKNQN